MKKMLKNRTFYGFNLLMTLAFILAVSSCTKEDIEIVGEEGVDPSQVIDSTSTTFSRVSPVAGKIYTITNVKNGRTIAVSGGSNSNGANVFVWGSDQNTSTTSRQWEIVSVGGNYVRIQNVNSGKSLEVASGSNSNNANVNQRTYSGSTHQQWEIISIGNDQYRIKGRDSGKSLRVAGTSNGSNANQYAYKGWGSQKFYFTEIGGNDTSSSGDAEDIIGSGWKLNGYTGNLNVSSTNNGLSYRDDASKSESHFFFERNSYAAFRCYAGNPRSGGSTNPRSELRELINGGDGYWDGDSNTEHRMKMRFRVEDLPPSGKLAFMQIHEKSDSFDDIIRVQVQGNSGQNSGSVDLRILGFVTEHFTGGGQTVNFNMNMDTEYYFELTMRNGVVRLYNLNNNGNRIQTLYTSPDVGNADQNFFKAGCYLQSTNSSHYSSNVYGQVLIKDLEVTPDN